MRGTLLALLLGLRLPLGAQPRILVATATAGFRHDSIGTAERVLTLRASLKGVTVVPARDEHQMLVELTPEKLRSVTAVFLVNTTGELPPAPREALLAWIRAGGTFVGFHSAADTWHSSAEYLEMIGAEFASHPPEFAATIAVADPTHAATAGLSSPHVMLEEIYSFTRFDPLRVRLLLETGGAPMAWEKSHSRGRVLYTALGHRDDVWLSRWFAAFIDGAITWAVQPRVDSRRRAVRP